MPIYVNVPKIYRIPHDKKTLAKFRISKFNLASKLGGGGMFVVTTLYRINFLFILSVKTSIRP